MSSIFHDNDSSVDDMLSDIADKHTPDSIRESAYRELFQRGYSREEVQDAADERYGDYW